MKKKLIAMLLSAALCFTCLPAQLALAEDDVPVNESAADTLPEPEQESVQPVQLEADQALTKSEPEIIEQWYPTFGDSQTEFRIDRSKGIQSAELEAYRGHKENVSLPHVYEDIYNIGASLISIVTIKSGAFNNENASMVRRVTIPESVKTIEANAFTCSKLEAVWIPANVEIIEEGAFPSKIEIYVEDDTSVAAIWGRNHDCTVVKVDEHLKIQNGALCEVKEGYAGETLVLPEIVFTFDRDLFAHTNDIKVLKLPSSFGGGERDWEYRNLNTFGYLEAIEVENNPNLSAKDGVLFNQTQTRLMFYPPNKPEAEYVIPEDTITVDNSAFDGSWNLKKLTLPSSLTSLDPGVLTRSEALEEVYVAEGNKLFAEKNGAIYGPGHSVWVVDEETKETSEIVTYGILFYPPQKTDRRFEIESEINGHEVNQIGSHVFFKHQYLAEIIIPDSVRYIRNQAFIYMPQLRSISIPEHATFVEQQGIFNGCQNLVNIEVAKGNPFLKSIDGVLFSSDGTKLLAYPAGRKMPFSYYKVPDGTKIIGGDAFFRNRSLRRIDLPEGVEVLEYGCFEECSSLQYIILPASLKRIEAYAFQDCSALTEAIFVQNGSLETIGRAAFSGCGRLLVIKIPDSVITIGSTGGNNPEGKYLFPDHTFVIAAEGSIMWKEDPANEGRLYGGKYLVTPDGLIHGDLNGDKQITMDDWNLLKQYLNKVGVEIDLRAADVNEDGEVNNKDDQKLLESLTSGFQADS